MWILPSIWSNSQQQKWEEKKYNITKLEVWDYNTFILQECKLCQKTGLRSYKMYCEQCQGTGFKIINEKPDCPNLKMDKIGFYDDSELPRPYDIHRGEDFWSYLNELLPDLAIKFNFIKDKKRKIYSLEIYHPNNVQFTGFIGDHYLISYEQMMDVSRLLKYHYNIGFQCIRMNDSGQKFHRLFWFRLALSSLLF